MQIKLKTDPKTKHEIAMIDKLRTGNESILSWLFHTTIKKQIIRMKTIKFIITIIIVGLFELSCNQGVKQVPDTQTRPDSTGNLIAKTHNSGFSLAHDT